MEKNIFLRTVAVLLMMSLVPPLFAEVGSITYTANYIPGNMSLGSDSLGGVTYTTVTYGDLTNSGQPGTPSLPVDYLRFSVPANATNFTVTALRSINMVQTIGHLVSPCQPPRLMNDTTAWTITPPDSAIYYSGIYYPSASGCAWIADEGFLAGENHIVTVAVMPVSFRNRSVGLGFRRTELSLSRSITLTLQYELSDSLAMYPIVRNDTTLRNEGYRLAQSMVVNPENVQGNAPLMPLPIDSINFNPRGGDGLNGRGDLIPGHPVDTLPYDTLPSYQMATYSYLIVTTPELKNSVRRIVALKRMKGYNVKVMTMDDVLNSPFSGDGDAIKQPDGTYQLVDTSAVGKLRQYLKYCFRNFGTKYILLVGSDIPYKSVYIKDKFNYYNFSTPAELYYSDLNTRWYSDTVDLVLEAEDSTARIDLGPELYVGRILANSAMQINNYVDKLYRYELNPGNGDYLYLSRAFFLDGRRLYGVSTYNTRKYLKSIYPVNNQTVFRDAEMPGIIFPTGKDVIDTLRSNPVGFICPLNHGDTTQIRTYGNEEDVNPNYFIHSVSNDYDSYGLNCMKNKDYPTIFYAPCCVTMPFDNHYGINVGESFTTGKDYGGPVYIGYTKKSISIDMIQTLQAFARNLKKGIYKLGEADALSKSQIDRDYMGDSFIHAYLGDPSLEIWTDTPQQFSGIGVSRTDNSITVSGIGEGSVNVTYISHKNMIKKIAIDTDSVTFNSVLPNGVIMLYKQNHIPYLTPMVLQNESLTNSHYAIASDVTAGSSVDSSRTSGYVIVRNGTNYEIEASGTVTLEDGFKVERGATFAVYPSCF